MSKLALGLSTKSALASLNRIYNASLDIISDVNTLGLTEAGFEDIGELLDKAKKLDEAFDRIRKDLEERGETLKFDANKGEYFLGNRTFRFKYTCVSEGTIEIEAENEETARQEAEKMADWGKITLKQVSGKLEAITEDA